jgi:hypothetical protein
MNKRKQKKILEKISKKVVNSYSVLYSDLTQTFSFDIVINDEFVFVALIDRLVEENNDIEWIDRYYEGKMPIDVLSIDGEVFKITEDGGSIILFYDDATHKILRSTINTLELKILKDNLVRSRA